MSVYDLYVRSLQYVLTRLLVDIGYSLTVSYNLEMVMMCDRVGANVNLTMEFLLGYDCRFGGYLTYTFVGLIFIEWEELTAGSLRDLV